MLKVMPKAMWIQVVLLEQYTIMLPNAGQSGTFHNAAEAVRVAERMCDILNESANGRVEWMVDVCDSTAIAMGFVRQ